MQKPKVPPKPPHLKPFKSDITNTPSKESVGLYLQQNCSAPALESSLRPDEEEYTTSNHRKDVNDGPNVSGITCDQIDGISPGSSGIQASQSVDRVGPVVKEHTVTYDWTPTNRPSAPSTDSRSHSKVTTTFRVDSVNPSQTASPRKHQYHDTSQSPPTLAPKLPPRTSVIKEASLNHVSPFPVPMLGSELFPKNSTSSQTGKAPAANPLRQGAPTFPVPPPPRAATMQQEPFVPIRLSTFDVKHDVSSNRLSELKLSGPIKVLEIAPDFVLLATEVSLYCYALGSLEKIWEIPVKLTTCMLYQDKLLYLGKQDGGIQVINASNGAVILDKPKAHAFSVYGIWFDQDIITLSRDGKLKVWLDAAFDTDPQTFFLQKDFSVAHYVGPYLWLAKGCRLYVYDPRPNPGKSVQVYKDPIVWGGSEASRYNTPGEFSSIHGDSQYVICGHTNGAVTLYRTGDVQPFACLNVGISCVTSILKVGKHIWAGLKKGTLLLLELTKGPAAELLYGWNSGSLPVSCLRLGDSTVASASGDSAIFWDATISSSLNDRGQHVNGSEHYTPLKIKILSWNVDSASPAQIKDGEFLEMCMIDPLRDQTHPDILVFGFQELVELESKTKTAKGFLKGTDSKLAEEYEAWQLYLVDIFSSSRYRCISSKSLVGLFSCIFVKDALYPLISNVDSLSVKTGLGGLHGNKGGIITRMNVGKTSFCFINCHLAAGHTNIIQRNKDADTILNTLLGTHLSGDTAFKSDPMAAIGHGYKRPTDYDSCFFFGDTNYRINTARELAISYIKARDWAKLYERDQLARQIAKNSTLSLGQFEEHPIDFPPTYKFDRGSENYDTSDKKRIPSWCDRILYKGFNVTINEYTSAVSYVSDHRPVIGTFTCKVLCS